MKQKSINKISISFIAVLLIVALAITLTSFMSAEQAQLLAKAEANTVMMYGEYVGTNGQIIDDLPDEETGLADGHYTKEEILTKYNITEDQLLPISDGPTLWSFLNGTESKKYAYLTSDISMGFAGQTGDGYYSTGAPISNSRFTGVLEGNGYTINIKAGAADIDTANMLQANAETTGDTANAWHEYAGYLCAINEGTIQNLTINYTSNMTITDPNNFTAGYVLKVASGNGAINIAGIVTGLNKGTIDNIKLNVNGSFSFLKLEGSNRRLFQNFAIAGGIAGAISSGIISNSQVNIANGVAIVAAAQGSEAGLSTDDKASGAMAGGIVGKIQVGDAKVHYCALTGSGQVNAYGHRVRLNEHRQSFAGGAIGASSNITGDVSMDGALVNAGQIKGIISTWTGSRSDNYAAASTSTVKTINGVLFDAVGSNVQSCAVLYDFVALTQQSGTPYTTLDSGGKLTQWTEIYPLSTGGKMYVRFDTSNTKYDLRIHAVADGYGDELLQEMNEVDMSKSNVSYHKFFINNGETGKILWEGLFDKNGLVSDHISLDKDMPMKAEIYMLKSDDYGTFNYTFGTISNVEYVNTNSTDGSLVKEYTGASGKLSYPELKFVNSENIQGSGNINWTVTRNNVVTDIKESYMPGTYTISAAYKVDVNTYAYFNDEERLMAWQPKTPYTFTIMKGNLSYGDATTNTEAWQKEYTFELAMPQAGDFDIIRYQINGTFANNDLTPESGANNIIFTTSDTTGKNGANYTFYAYKYDNILQDYVQVAVSSSKTVKIDSQSPEISDIQYNVLNADGTKTQIYEHQLADWRKESIEVTYIVTDYGKSNFNPNILGVTHQLIEGTNNYKATYVIENNASKQITYVDGVGNTTSMTLQANVDQISGVLDLKSVTGYNANNLHGYDHDGFTVNYVASIGGSGWTMYYSTSKDSEGNDIWVEGATLKNGATTSLIVNWDMGDVMSYTGSDLKMKMVNNVVLDSGERLYPDVYITGGNTEEGGLVGNYLVCMRIADIYLNINLNSIIESESGRSIADILASGEGAKFFNKEYDSTTDYTNYTFKANIDNADTKVKYTIAYPLEPELNFDKIDIVMQYSNSAIGANKLRIWADLGEENQNKYAVWFVDFSQVDFDELYGTVPEIAYQIHEIDAEITKIKVDVDLATELTTQGLQSFLYGEEIPKSIEVQISTGEYITVELRTNAKKGSAVGNYTIEGVLGGDNKSIELNVVPAKIEIVQRPVFVDLKFDDGEIPTSIQFDGKEHSIKGTYVDVMTGKEVGAKVTYYTDASFGNEVSSIKEIGKYYVKVSISDANYKVLGLDNFVVTITQGFLPISTGVVNVDYTGDNATYKMNIPKELEDYYTSEELTLTYYKYYDGAYYDEKTGTVVGNYDMNAPTTDTKEIGIYRVEINFTGNEYFGKQEYSDGILIVNRAKTVINSDDELVYSFDSDFHTIILKEIKAEVKASDESLLWDSKQEEDGVMVVKYFDTTTSSFMPISASPEEGNGWFYNVGEYRFQIEYLGTENYMPATKEVKLTITKAVFKNVKFESTTFTYDQKAHTVSESIPAEYNTPDVKKTYIYSGRTYTSLQEIMDLGFGKNVGEYTITLRLEKEDYTTLELKASVTINAADLEGVSVGAVSTTYDGQPHYVTFTGLEKNGDTYTYKGQEANVSGDIFAVNAGIYNGKVIIFVNNYNILELDTYIEIYQAPISATEAKIDLPEKLPSGVSITQYKGYFTMNGEQQEGELLFYNADNQLVEPDENGVLPDGKYTVRISVDRNHYVDAVWTLNVGRINDSNLSVGAWIAIASVGAFVIVAIAVAVIVVSKRKNNKSKKNQIAG